MDCHEHRTAKESGNDEEIRLQNNEGICKDGKNELDSINANDLPYQDGRSKENQSHRTVQAHPCNLLIKDDQLSLDHRIKDEYPLYIRYEEDHSNNHLNQDKTDTIDQSNTEHMSVDGEQSCNLLEDRYIAKNQDKKDSKLIEIIQSTCTVENIEPCDIDDIPSNEGLQSNSKTDDDSSSNLKVESKLSIENGQYFAVVDNHSDDHANSSDDEKPQYSDERQANTNNNVIYENKNEMICNQKMKSDTVQNVHICNECGFKSASARSLKVHKFHHAWDKPFKCDLCSFSTTSASHITTHRKVHTDKNKFRSDKCEDKFEYLSKLNKHKITHERVASHTCNLCDYTSTTLSGINRHNMNAHIRKTTQV